MQYPQRQPKPFWTPATIGAVIFGACFALTLLFGHFLSNTTTDEPSASTATDEGVRAIQLYASKHQVEELLGPTTMSTENAVRTGLNQEYRPGLDRSAWLYSLPDNGVASISFGPDGFVTHVGIDRNQTTIYSKGTLPTIQ